MSGPDHPRHQTRTVLGFAALIALPVLCCAGPALLGVAALTTGLGVLGGALGSPWLLGAAAVLTLAVVAWWRSRRARSGDGAPWGPSEPHRPAPSVDRAVDPDRAPIQHQER
jgi:membrane protein implicated in regulation of membrane protease activity